MTYTPPVYPGTLPDGTTDLPDRKDDVDWFLAARYNELKKELVACLKELGTDPAGSETDLKTRLAVSLDDAGVLKTTLEPTFKNLTLTEGLICGGITSSGASLFNSGSIDADFQVNWNTGIGLFVQGSTGFVGLRTNNPKTALEVYNGTIGIEHLASGNVFQWGYAGYYDGYIKVNFSGTEANNYVSFGVQQDTGNASAIEVMRLRGNNCMGVGNTFPIYKLDVKDSVSGIMTKFFNDGGTTSYLGVGIQMGSDDGSGVNLPLLIYDGNGTLEGGIQLINGTVSIYDVSDERTKENIIETTDEDTFNKFLNTDIFSYNYIHLPNVKKEGFVAQNLAIEFPEAVSYIEHEDLYVTSQTNLIPEMFKAIKKLIKINEALEVRVKELEK